MTKLIFDEYKVSGKNQMAWATELKNLVEDIQSSTVARARFVRDVKKDTKDLLADYDKQLAEMAKDLKDFLSKSELTRMEEFKAMMHEINGRIKAIEKDTADVLEDSNKLMAQYKTELKKLATEMKDFLSKSELIRMGEFKKMMQFITSDVTKIKKATGALLGDYSKERKEAHHAWVTLAKKEARPHQKKEAEE